MGWRFLDTRGQLDRCPPSTAKDSSQKVASAQTNSQPASAGAESSWRIKIVIPAHNRRWSSRSFIINFPD